MLVDRRAARLDEEHVGAADRLAVTAVRLVVRDVLSSISPRSTPSRSAIRSAKLGCERPEKTISRFCGVSGGHDPGFNAGSTGSLLEAGERLLNRPGVHPAPPSRPAAWREPHQGVVEPVIRHDRAGGCPRVVSQVDWCNEHSVHTDPDVTADCGAPLRTPRLDAGSWR